MKVRDVGSVLKFELGKGGRKFIPNKGAQNLKKNLEPLQNPGRQKGGMKQVLYTGPIQLT